MDYKNRKFRLSRLGIETKTALGLGALLFFALVIMGGAIYDQSVRLAMTEVMGNVSEKINKSSLEIEDSIEACRNDLLVIADTPPVQGIIRATDNKGIDPFTGDKIELWHARMVQIFGAFLKNHPEYYQIRYLDEKGYEIVSTTIKAKDKTIVPAVARQDKAIPPYFSEAIKLKPGEIYHSDIRLNRKDGAIQLPHTPVLRLATPIYDAAQRARGIIILNVFADSILTAVKTDSPTGNSYIVNQDGFFLLNRDRSKTFGFDLGFAYGIKNSHPELAAEIISKDFMVMHEKQKELVSGFRKIFFDHRDKNRFWAIIHEYPEAIALKNLNKARTTMFFGGSIIIILSIMAITWAVSKKIISPIVTLAKAVDKMEEGDLTARVTEDQSGDELGQLAQSFNRMAGTIEQHVNESVGLKLQREQILNCAGDGIYGVDLDGNCIFINSAAAKMFGRNAEDLLGQHIHSLMHYNKTDGTPYPAQECQIYSVLRDGVAKHVSEDLFSRYDGSAFPVEYTSTPIIDNNRITGVVVVYRDTTLRKQTEEELQKHRENLEELVLQRTAEADAANKTKSAFLANMSHELRTPLNAIIGFSDILISGMSGELTSSQKEHLGYIHESGEHLLSLINDVLDLSKVEAGKIELEIGKARVRDVLNTSIIMLKEKAMTHNIRTNLAIEPDADLEVEADERKLKQIVFNLMSNAVKFTPDGGTVSLRARQVSESGRTFVEVSVADSGIGIKEEDVGRLFTPFMRLETTYIKQGTGLGLALTKQLVELHGGRIWVESEFGKGSTFAFRIPVKQEDTDV